MESLYVDMSLVKDGFITRIYFREGCTILPREWNLKTTAQFIKQAYHDICDCKIIVDVRGCGLALYNALIDEGVECHEMPFRTIPTWQGAIFNGRGEGYDI